MIYFDQITGRRPWMVSGKMAPKTEKDHEIGNIPPDFSST